MFERYTDAARQALFAAEEEAVRSGSAWIEPEHFVLALLKQETSPLRKLLPAGAEVSIDGELRQTAASTPGQATSDVPLSHPMKRVLAHGAQAAEDSRDPYIRPEHLLLGLLKDTESTAARVLEKHGITRERVLAEHGAFKRPTVNREMVIALVATLPDAALERAHTMLQHLQAWPPHRSARAVVAGAIGGSGSSWSMDSQGKLRNGCYSSGRIEDGTQVTETHRFFEDHEIAIIERVRLTEEGKKLSYSQEIRGPRRDHSFEIDFDIT